MKRTLPARDRTYSFCLTAILAACVCPVALLQFPLRNELLGICLALLALAILNHGLWKIPFFPYDRIFSAVSEDGLAWTPEPGVRLDVGGVHRSCQVYYPAVIPVEEGWRMYYRAGGYDSAIGSAFSSDGLCWEEEPGLRLAPGGDAELTRLDGPAVVRLGPDDWRLYYAGFGDGRWRICAARSADSRNWRPEAVCLGPTDDGDAKDPCVIRWASGFRIYFTRHGADRSDICTAVSEDGLEWDQPMPCAGYNPAGLVVRSPHVVALRDAGLRLYFAEFPRRTATGSRIVSATSTDGVHWTRELGVRVGPRSWRGLHGTFCPALVALEGGWRIYFGGYWGRHWLAPYTLLRHRER